MTKLHPLWRKRQLQGLKRDKKKNGCCCKLVNCGSRSVDGAMEALLSELDDIFSLNKQAKNGMKGFSLLLTGFCRSSNKHCSPSRERSHSLNTLCH